MTTPDIIANAEKAVIAKAHKIAYEKSNNIDDHKIQSTMYELCKSYIILGARLMQDELFKNGYYEAKENID